MLRPISLSQYYRPEPLTELVTELCDTNRYPDARAKGVDELVLSLVQRYALDFAHCTTLDDLRRENADPEEAFAASGSALRRKMESTANKHDHTGLPLSCLRDFRSSASLVREIAFGSSFVPSERGTCVDLGIGSGILSLGSIIALFRAGAKNVICHGVDRSPYLTQCSAETLTKIPGVDVQMIVADLRDASLYSALPRNAQIWTSETINAETPALRIGEKVELAEEDLSFEPYPAALRQLAANIPNFLPDVRSRRVGLFPNAVDGSYRPKYMGNRLLLHTAPQARYYLLDEIGVEFENHATLCTGKRW